MLTSKNHISCFFKTVPEDELYNRSIASQSFLPHTLLLASLRRKRAVRKKQVNYVRCDNTNVFVKGIEMWCRLRVWHVQMSPKVKMYEFIRKPLVWETWWESRIHLHRQWISSSQSKCNNSLNASPCFFVVVIIWLICPWSASVVFAQAIMLWQFNDVTVKFLINLT